MPDSELISAMSVGKVDTPQPGNSGGPLTASGTMNLDSYNDKINIIISNRS